jgi:hypothetical protein
MKNRILTLAGAAFACLTLAGCVSESGYATYDRTYTRYEGPSYIYRADRRSRDWDRRHHDRREWNRHRDARRDDHHSRRDWDRDGRRHDTRGKDERSDRRTNRSDRDGRPSRSDRIWMPDN